MKTALRSRLLPGRRRRRADGFLIIESMVAFAILAMMAVLVFASLHRMDENLARTRCEAHLGMICNQYSELYQNIPWDQLADAATDTTAASGQGFINFGGGNQGGFQIPYRVNVEYRPPTQTVASQQTAQVIVDVYWSPPDPSQEQALLPSPGAEVEYRRIVVNRTRY